MRARIITIDGPAAAGKTTVTKKLAQQLRYLYVDTGALYRAVAFEIKQKDIQWQNDLKLTEGLKKINLELILRNDSFVLLSSGRDITNHIRTSEISMLASAVSAISIVRLFLLDIQRSIAKKHNAVYEGRDMGTVVFPDADFKFFLFADIDTRALRRLNEMKLEKQNIEDIKQDITKRDKNDFERKDSPLKPASDAIMVDSTNLTVNEVVEKIVWYVDGNNMSI